MVQTEAGRRATAGEKYEGIAFTFCKAATIILVSGRYALPVASGLCAVFYLKAYCHGQRTTRCWARYPLLIAAFWGTVCLVALLRLTGPVP